MTSPRLTLYAFLLDFFLLDISL